MPGCQGTVEQIAGARQPLKTSAVGWAVVNAVVFERFIIFASCAITRRLSHRRRTSAGHTIAETKSGWRASIRTNAPPPSTIESKG